MPARFASAAARALADEFGLDVDECVGTGRDGRVTLADVRALAPPDPPDGIGEAGAALWRAVRADYDLRADEEAILASACRTLDEIGRLEAKLGSVSLTVSGSRGQVRPHPLLSEVRAHRLAFKQLLAAIGIDEANAAGGGGGEGAARSHAGRQLARQRWSRRG